MGSQAAINFTRPVKIRLSSGQCEQQTSLAQVNDRCFPNSFRLNMWARKRLSRCVRLNNRRASLQPFWRVHDDAQPIAIAWIFVASRQQGKQRQNANSISRTYGVSPRRPTLSACPLTSDCLWRSPGRTLACAAKVSRLALSKDRYDKVPPLAALVPRSVLFVRRNDLSLTALMVNLGAKSGERQP